MREAQAPRAKPLSAASAFMGAASDILTQVSGWGQGLSAAEVSQIAFIRAFGLR